MKMKMVGSMFVAGIASLAILKILAATLLPVLAGFLGFLFLVVKIVFFIGLAFFVWKMFKKMRARA